MAQRSTGFAKKPPAVEVPRVEAPLRPLPEEPIAPDPIPIDLAPLVAPYRRHGRLSVRVERLPPRARLSHGHFNSDRSWSLALDELDGVTYLPATQADIAPTLALRIIRLDGGDGGTLALLDYTVVPPDAPVDAVERVDTKELRRLHEEMAKLKASLAIRDAELARVRQEAEPVTIEFSREVIDAELAAMRSGWETEAETRIAAAVKEATARLSKDRSATQHDEDARVAKAEKAAQERLAGERERLRKEADAALRKAEKDWKAAEAARVAAVEADWKKRSEKALADATAQFEKSKTRAQLETARTNSNDGELRKLRDDLSKTAKALEDREADLARERAIKTQTRDETVKQYMLDLARLRSDLAKTDAALADRNRELEQEKSAIKTLRAEAETLRGSESEAQRLREELSKLGASLGEREKAITTANADAQAERKSADAKLARLSEELAKARAALSARESELSHVRSGEKQVRAEAESLRGDSAELKRVTAELVSAKASLAVREAELAGARTAHEEERARWRRDLDAALGDAKATFKESEADRLAAAESEWRKQSEVAIADVVTRLHEAEAKLREGSEQGEKAGAELVRLREDRTTLKSQLADLENQLLQTKLSQEQARERWKRETDEALHKAQKAWKADETARIAASEALAKDHNTIALNETTARLKHTEALLAEAKTHIETLRRRGDADDVALLRRDFASVQAQLARREQEVMELRADHEIERVRMANEARASVQQADHRWREEDPDDQERQQRLQGMRSLFRTVVIAAAFAGLAAVGYYKIAPMITDTGVLDPILPQNSAAPALPSSRVTTQTPALIVLRAAKLRAGPSTTASVIGSLPLNAQVSALDRQGKWVKVELAGKANGKPQQGWVYGSVLNKSDVKSPSLAPKK